MNDKQKRIVEMVGKPEAALHMELFSKAMEGNVDAYNRAMEIAYGKKEDMQR